MWALSVPVRVGCVSYTYVLCERTTNQCAPTTYTFNIDDASHTKQEKKTRCNMFMYRCDDDARPSGRTDGRRRLSGMLAAWRPPRLPLAASPSPRQRPPCRLQCARAARRLASRCPTGRPGRHRIRRSSPPPCASLSSVRPRCHRSGTPCACGRRQAGMRVGRQVKWTSERRSRARIRGADRAQGSKKAGGMRGRAHTCSPRRPKSSLMMPYE